MSPEMYLKIQQGYRWMLVIMFAFAGLMLINEGIVDYKVSKFAESAKEVPLSSVLKNRPDGKWIKISDFEIDVRKRVRALPDKSSINDLHILIPLRVPGERNDAPIRFLFRLDEYSDDPISRAYTAYQDSGILVLEGEPVFAEIVPIDDLAGNVPTVLRNDDRIAKNAVVFNYLPIRTGYEFNFGFGAFLIGLSFFMHWRIRRTKKKSAPKFY